MASAQFDLNSIYSWIPFRKKLNEYGFTKEGYDRTVSEILEEVKQKYADQQLPNDSEIQTQIEEIIFRSVVIELTDPIYVADAFRKYFLTQNRDAIPQLNTYLFESFTKHAGSEGLKFGEKLKWPTS